MKYLKFFMLWIIFLFLLYTFAGFIIVPWFLTNMAPSILKDRVGINIKAENANFNPYTLEVNIKNIMLQNTDKESLLSIKKLYINFSPIELFSDTFFLSKISVYSPKLYVKFRKNGKINLAAALPKSSNNEKKPKSSKISFPHIILDELEVINGRVNFNDQRDNKNLILDLGPYNFQAGYVSAKKNRINFYILKTKLNNNGTLFWEGGIELDPFVAYGVISTKDLNLAKLYNYAFTDFDAILQNALLDSRLPFEVSVSNGVKVKIYTAQLRLSKIIMNTKTTKQTLLNIPKVRVDYLNLKWPKKSISIKTVDINKASIDSTLEKQKILNFMKIFTIKNDSQKSSKSWDFLLSRLNIKNLNINLTDSSLNKPLITKIKNISLSARNISSKKDQPIHLSLSGLINKDTNINISSRILQTPLSVNSRISLSHLNLSDFNPYIEPFINFKIKNALIDLKTSIKTDFKQKTDISLVANTNIHNLILNSLDDETLIKWKDLRINNIEFTNTSSSLNIQSLSLLEPYIKGNIYKNGKTNFSNLIKEQRDAKSKERQNNFIKVKVGVVKFIDGVVDFSDESQLIPFKTHIYDLNGDISTLDFENTTPSTIELNGKLDKYGYTDARGAILPFQFKKKANINLLLKNINLNSLTPYFRKIIRLQDPD